MVKVVAPPGASVASIAGRGISVTQALELSPGVVLRPSPPKHEAEVVAEGCESLQEYAAILSMTEFATFFIEVADEPGGSALAARTWNSLWLFHLLALACKRPCDALYCWSGSSKIQFSLVTPHVVSREQPTSVLAAIEQLEWARTNIDSFHSLMSDPKFITSLLSYTNSHHLFGYRPRIMQMWSGIESLFNVSSEISRTVALYSSLMLEKENVDARYACFKRIKKDYDARSRVVHGGVSNESALEEAYRRASEILAALLARCVELARVPTPEELDRVALYSYLRT